VVQPSPLPAECFRYIACQDHLGQKSGYESDSAAHGEGRPQLAAMLIVVVFAALPERRGAHPRGGHCVH
jgi:hypothetical protein